MNPVFEQILFALVGWIGVPIVNVIKDKFFLEGKQAVVLAGAVSLVLAVVALLLSGQLDGGAFTVENLANTFAIVLGAGQLAYKLLSK